MDTTEPPSAAQATSTHATPSRWQPLAALERRVAGVLAEKAKTTPDAYPMTVNGLVAGCNQKSNRFPVMEVEAEDVEAALDRLRALGAVGIVQGSGRVDKYRHYLYEWLGVEKVELAVMAELLLRGAQTEGELRSRAARMDPIPDLTALRPVLDSLKAKGLVIPLSPQGRGHMVTHALYEPRELEKVRSQAEAGVGLADGPAEGPSGAAASSARAVAATAPVAAPSHVSGAADMSALRREFDEMRQAVKQLRSDFDELAAELRRDRDEIARLKDALGG